ncbi:MAG: tripartite tricarboxylate transporter substrate binding protein [Candidatus Protistobacter heckmanni]|nr:tripartite tricarboxylate transporter substrate binding protein [Candidatus Protistobacter heckmanni]
MKLFRSLMLAALGLPSLPLPVFAQAAWTSKPLHLIVPYSPGGGASGVIAATALAQADPDCYTVLYDASTFAVNPALRKQPFDPARDLIPASLAVTVPNILVVAPNAPYRSFAEFIDYARKNPGKTTFASYGSGLTYVTTGNLRVLAVTSSKRMTALPEVPTISESGFKGFEVLEWNGFFLPKNAPREIVQKLSKEIQAAAKDADTLKRLRQLNVDPVGGTPEEFADFLHAEMTRWTALVKSNKITAD